MLDLDATDDPLHGEQEGRHFHGNYDCYCYLPLYIFCGRHLLAAKLRTSSVDAADGGVAEVARVVGQIGAPSPATTIVIRAYSGFCCDDLTTWCEANTSNMCLDSQEAAASFATSRPKCARSGTVPSRVGSRLACSATLRVPVKADRHSI